MLTTDQFFAAFARAGILKEAAWTPSGGGPTQTPQVRFHAPEDGVLSGEVLSTDYAIEYPASLLVGIKRDEVVRIDGQDYTLRENPRRKLDGSLLEAKLRKGS